MSTRHLRFPATPLVLLAALTAAACGGSPSSPTPSPTPTPTPPACAFTVGDAPAGNMASAAGEFTIAVTTTAACAWTATSSASFITAGAAGGTGSGSVKFNVTANTGGSRQGAVQVAGRTLTVSQSGDGTGCEFTVDPAQATVTAAATSVSVTVTRTAGANCAWTATTQDSFLSIQNGASGVDNGTVVLGVAINPGDARTGTATIAGRVVTISQGPDCAFGVTPTTIPIGAAGGTAQLTVTITIGGMNCRWTVTSNASFITSNTASAAGPGNPTLTIAANTGAARTGTVTVGGQTVTVNQAAGGGSPAGPIAVLSYQSAPGDFIGGGASNTYTLTGSEFTVTLNAAQSQLEFNIPPSGGTWWTLRLRSQGGGLGPGLYEQAQRASFAPLGTPGLDFSGSGRGCNKLTGRFLIQTAVYSGTQVQRFHARFQQHCEGWSTPLHGQIWIDASGASAPSLADFPASPSTPITQVSYTSDPGDFVGGGQSGSFTLSGIKAIAWASESRPAVDINFQSVPGVSPFWNLSFGAASGARLQPGTYNNATRYPFNSGVPGLSVSNGNGCNTLTGSFVVLEAVYGPQGEVLRFHATFEQHCEGVTPALRGEVRIVADPWR